MISPKDQERLAIQVSKFYKKSELIILQRVANKIKDGIELADWEQQKLSQISQLRREVYAEFSIIDKKLDNLIAGIVQMAYLSGRQSVLDDLQEIYEELEGTPKEKLEQLNFHLFPEDVENYFTVPPLQMSPSTMLAVNTGAIKALSAALIGDIRPTHLQIVRETEDVFRAIVADVSGVVPTGAYTRLQAAQEALNRFHDKGISTIRYKDGSRRKIASYVEMATRSTVGQAAIQGHIDQSEHYGLDLQIVDDHQGSCSLCAPFEGKILATKPTEGYMTVQEAKDAGLFHPNCSHRLNLYVEGLTKRKVIIFDPKQNEDRQKQRYYERQIRKWKERQALAITPQEKQKTANKVREWTGILEEHVDVTNLPRKRNRESINAAR